MARGLVAWPTEDQLPPNGKKGVAQIDRFVIGEKEENFTLMRQAMGNRGAHIPQGTYVRLGINGSVMMSNTPTELRESELPVARAHGRVLIAGLGLGVMLHPILAKEEVEHVTLVEISKDVIDLVQPSLQEHIDAGRLTIICADFREWVPKRGTRYQCVWIDIWQDICSDQLPLAKALTKKYKRRLEKGDGDPWVDTWMDACAYRMRW